MHGRVKVKSTEQQEREKKLERVAKLGAYRKAMTTVLNRRAEGAKDDQQLRITAQVLQSNPDIHTLWNIRREVLLHLIQSEQTCGSEDTAENKEENRDNLLQKEVELTQQCLMVNPKSYGAWHHRSWSLEHMEKPSWERELALCNRYLKLDERNFHCWDYRQYAAKKAGIGVQRELDFSMEKIGENFSNYSAWHYRSKLLSQLYPHPFDPASIQEEKLYQELELVQNAAFTDPEDSSAWFYHTWLLGRQKEQTEIIYCLWAANTGKLTVALTNAVESTDLVLRCESGNPLTPMWQSSGGDRFSNLWSTELTHSGALQYQLECSTSVIKLRLPDVKTSVLTKGPGWKSLENPFQTCPSPESTKALQQALENCNQLLELEPDSKWTLYTKVLILKTLDSRFHHKEILSTLVKLRSVDSLRENYYIDFAGRLETEKRIEECGSSGALLDLSDLPSSRRYHSQYYPVYCAFQD